MSTGNVGNKRNTPGGDRPRGPGTRERLKQEQEQAARRRRERRILGIVALVAVLLVVGGGIGVQLWRTGRAPSAGPSISSTFGPVTITNGKPIVLGSAQAPVRMQLYEDFHCPHCAEFEEQLGPTVTAAQDSGELAVELYPMSFIDSGSVSAANAMACAAESGFGPAYYLGLFANSTLGWSDDQLIDLATQVSSSVPDAFRTCVTTKAHQPYVDSVTTAAAANGVTGTPTMFLNGDPVDLTGLTPASLQGMIDQAASK